MILYVAIKQQEWTLHRNSTHSLSISKHSGIISFHTAFHQWFHTLFINLCLMTKIKEQLLKINNLPSSMKYWVYSCMEKEIIRHEVFFLNLPATCSFPKPIVNFLHQHLLQSLFEKPSHLKKSSLNEHSLMELKSSKCVPPLWHFSIPFLLTQKGQE